MNTQHYAMRKTQLRTAMRDILQSHKMPLTVSDLRTLLRKKGVTPHKTSLYRNLDHMVAIGEIERIMLDTSVTHYELQRSHHHHIICDHCNVIACIDSSVMERRVDAIARDVAKQSHFVINDHQFSFTGLCNKCQ